MKLYTTKFLEELGQFPVEQVLIYDSGNEICAGELLQNSKNIAVGLRELGFTRNSRVILAMDVGIEFLEVIYACMMCGAELSIIDPEMGRDHYKSMVEQFDPEWAFVDSRLLLLQEHPILRWIYFRLSRSGIYFPKNDKVRQIACGMNLTLFSNNTSLKDLRNSNESRSVMVTPASDKHKFITTYTSGTLSKPKGVVHTYKSVSKGVEQIVHLIGNLENQRMATHLPHFMLIAISANVSAYLWKEDWSAQKKIDFIEEYSITLLFAPPAEYLRLMKYCEKKSRQFPACLEHIILGSAPAHQIFLKKLIKYLAPTTKVTCIYGMTEHILVSSVDGRKKAEREMEGDLLGTPVQGVEVKIAEDKEILIHSEQLFKGYLNQNRRGKYHKTGDLAFLNEYKEIVLIGRKKDMIIRENFNIYPALYEPTIKKIPGVEEAVLIGAYNEESADENVHLFIDSDQKLRKNKIFSFLKSGKWSIAREALPDYIHFCKIPRSGRQNKIDRNKLRQSIQIQGAKP